ncbi:unnamed protein product [Prunus armeniaca]|uniref:Uncharacterized protein n=1 Tax=Prunus armeniaca TaxID=36596 RepID=A0A6J5V802_PRUAR|nr:unnamed protein product [Prunus armeniaca]CAB4314679.1 unnamed protein product [Prunus armeniaca]
MSNKEVEEERRLYQCARKYEKIVKQFDELIEMMNTRSRLPKRRKNSTTAAPAPAPASQHEDNEVFAQTITRFLQDLRTNPAEPDCSTAPGDGN